MDENKTINTWRYAVPCERRIILKLELTEKEVLFIKNLLPRVQATGEERIIIEKLMMKLDPEYMKLWNEYDKPQQNS